MTPPDSPVPTGEAAVRANRSEVARREVKLLSGPDPGVGEPVQVVQAKERLVAVVERRDQRVERDSVRGSLQLVVRVAQRVE